MRLAKELRSQHEAERQSRSRAVLCARVPRAPVPGTEPPECVCAHGQGLPKGVC